MIHNRKTVICILVSIITMPKKMKNIKCAATAATLPPALGQAKIPRNFFFYWSSPKGQKDNFNLVNYLSVLSLLKTNRVERCEIYYENESKSKYWQKLRQLNKVKLRKLDFDALFEEAGLDKRDFKYFLELAGLSQISDLFRYLVLYCYGGVYLDFDILMIKDFEPLLNAPAFAGIQHYWPPKSIVNGAVLGAAKGAPVITRCLNRMQIIAQKQMKRIIAQKPVKLRRVAVGPNLLTRVLLFGTPFKRPLFRLILRLNEFRFAKNKHVVSALAFLVDAVINRQLDCKILPKSYFYHYSWNEWAKIFQDNELPKDAYLIHLWFYHSSHLIGKMDEEYIMADNSLYSSIAKEYLKQ